MAGRPPSMIGVMIRDVLRRQQPQHIAAIGRAVNRLRKEEGMPKVSYHTMNRYIREAKEQGLVEVVEEVPKAGDDWVPDHPELNYMTMVQIKRGFTRDKRWDVLPSLVAGKI